MANQVYANNMEVSCKAADGKSICAFPDVCFTPPQTPATPTGVPIPYPNTGLATDTTDGSRTVSISGKEIMLKNKSYFKRSTGDEAGCAPNKGIINAQNMGKVYFKAWSMDVKVEGENAVRHFDLTTHNHASEIANDSIPWLHIDAMAVSMNLSEECLAEKNTFETACKDCVRPTGGGPISASATGKAMCDKEECKEARRCALLPYACGCCAEKDATGQVKKETPHHVIPNSLMQGKRGKTATNANGLKGYTLENSPCICCTGQSQNAGEHGVIHDQLKEDLRTQLKTRKPVTYQFAAEKGAAAAAAGVAPPCNAECVKAQVDTYFESHAEDGADNLSVNQRDGATRWKAENHFDGDMSD